MSRAGPILAKIGGVFMIVGGGIFLVVYLGISLLLFLFEQPLNTFGTEYLWISQVITIALGILALNARKRTKKGSKIGIYMLLIVGVFAAIGSFIPIVPARAIDLGVGQTFIFPAITINATFLFVDPYLIICAGIIELLEVKEPGEAAKIVEKEEKELTDKKKEKEEIRKKSEALKIERKALKKRKKNL